MAHSISRPLSRRTLIQTCIAAGASLARSGLVSGSADLPLIKKIIPSTGEQLPVMGIGTNSFQSSNFERLRDVLKHMHELGGALIDTAAMYGDSEAIIGKALGELGIRNQMFLATKFNAKGAKMPGPPPGLPGGPAGPGGGPGGPPPGWPPFDNVFGEASFERSLRRLRTDHVDLMQIHNLSSVDPLMPLLQKLKKDGKTRYIGITTAMPNEHAELMAAMRKYPIDFIQVDYSLGNREAAETIFPLAHELKIAVMIDVPLGGQFGSLLAQTSGRPLPPWAADFDVSTWSQFFLKYVISHPAVTCAIPGSSQLDHLLDNQRAGHGRLPDAAMRKRMELFWDTKA